MTNNSCFIDTSALIALNNARDQHHDQAKEIASVLKDDTLFITDTVITETYTLLRYRLHFQAAHYFLKSVLSNPFTIAEVTTPIRLKTLEILEQYSDQRISYCDALNAAVMQELNIHKIFAFDHHFEVMGVDLVRI